MRPASLTVCLFLICLTSVKGDELPELQKLEDVYITEIDRVTRPVKSKYYKALVRLQKKFTTTNQRDEALAVKQELDRLLSPSPDNAKPAPAEPTVSRTNLPVDDDDDKGENDSTDLRKWKGDGRVVDQDGEKAIKVEAVASGVREVGYTFDAEDFPKGVILKFEYMAVDYEGNGLMLRGYNSPTGSYHHPEVITSDNRWVKKSWVFEKGKYLSPTTQKEAEEIRMVIQVLSGSGEVFVKNLEITDL